VDKSAVRKFGTAMDGPVSPLVANVYMEYLERKILDTAPVELKPRLWQRYVDDILEVVKKTSVDELTDFLNSLVILAASSSHMRWNVKASSRFWTS